jgi:VWFA-related protein
VLATTAVAGQPSAPPFRSAVEAVRLDVSVMRGGQPVRGLTAADFVVYDNDLPQRAEIASVDALPVSVMLLLDVSASVQGSKLAHLAEASAALVNTLRPDDSAALLTFSHEVRMWTPLTRDRGALLRALGSVTAGGATALRDAVHLALQLRPDDDSRPVVVVFSDGLDNASWLSVAELLAIARRAGVVIHGVELLDVAPGERERSSDCIARPPTATGRRFLWSPFLECLVSAAGGRLWTTASPGELRPLFTRVLDEMRARYLLTFYPPAPARAGWHELKVSLREGRADIRARPGYFVPPPR